MIALKLNELVDHCVFEFTYEYDRVHWKESSIYVNDEDMKFIEPYISKVISPYFDYYGPEKVEISDWNKIKEMYISENTDENVFFETIDKWIKNRPNNNSYFWILGI